MSDRPPIPPTAGGPFRDEDIRMAIARTQWELKEMQRQFTQGMGAIEKRLNQGSETMAELRNERRPNVWIERSKVVGIVVIVAGLFFAAGKYPDRSEFERRLGVQTQKIEDVDQSVREMRAEVRDVGRTLGDVKKRVEAATAPKPTDIEVIDRRRRR